ncbi:MAG TPA: DNA repair protein RecO [Nevskiaceae bacterium]|nr:DNA repair protein RecO [Nevskiaceae bacterium]
MPRERIKLQPAWLLSVRPYRETSALLEAFSQARGRVGLVARGARGQRSKLRGVLQPFQPLLLSWLDSGELGTLTGAESAGRALGFTGEQIFSAWYVNELLMRLLPRRDAQPLLYTAYQHVLPCLCGGHAEAALRNFEMDLLETLGYALPLAGDIEAGAHYAWDPEQGARLAVAGEGCSGAALLALRERRFEEATTRREVRALLRGAVDRQLGGRELESRRLLRAVRAGGVK